MPHLLILTAVLAATPLAPGDHTRTLQVDGRERSCLVHVPPKFDPKKPTPVVLIFHGAGTNALIMVGFCGMNKKSDEAGFVAVYPNGTGAANLFLTWNAGGFQGPRAKQPPVRFIGKSTKDISANDLTWEFFERHPMR